jgi:hypothetical protein
MDCRDLRRGTVLVYFIHRLDALLRQLYRISEFTDDPSCILRLAMKLSSTPLKLNDDTRIMPGDPVGEFHLWNDHVPRFPPGGPTLGWARQAHRLVVHSLSLLADHVENGPEWQQVRAFYADVPISSKPITGLGTTGSHAIWLRACSSAPNCLAFRS